MRLRSLDRRGAPTGAEQLLVGGLVAAAGAALWRGSATPHQGLVLAVGALVLLGGLLLVLHDLERYVLVVVFCSMVFPQSLVSPGGSHVALADLLLLLALACWLAWFAVRREPVAWLRGNPYLAPALAFAGITLASVLWSTNWVFSVKQALQILELVVVVPVLFASVPTSLDRIRQALVAFVVFASGLAVVVFSYFIGRVAKGDVSPEYLPGMHKNATGGFIGVAIVLTYGLALERRPGARRIAALLPLELAGLFGTISRGAMVGTAFALLLVTLLVGRRRLLTIAFVAAVTVAFLVTIQSSLPEGGYSSVATRPESYSGGIRWIQAHPLFGTGAGTYNDFLPKAHIGLRDPNNLFLLTWAELGVFGLLLLLVLLARIARGVAQVRAAPQPASTLGCTVAAAAFSNLVHWQFDTTWARGTATITFALVGLVYAVSRLAPAPAAVAAADEPRTAPVPVSEPRRHLRVLQVVASTGFGGPERNVVALARGLRERGVDCRIACPFDAEGLRAAAGQAGVPVAPAAGRGAWLPQLAGLLEANPPELVHAHDAPAAVVGVELADAIGSAFVRTHRSQGAAELDADWRGRTIETLPVAVELPSPERLARRAEDVAALGRPAAVLLGGTDSRSADLVLLALARLRLRVPRFRLVVAGADDAAFRRLAEELAVADAIEWTGPLRRGADLFRRADVAVSPSAVGDDDLAAIEAMAWGLPVVAPGGDARTDLVEDGATGVLFRPGDARDLAAALVQLAGDPAWAAALGASARRYAESRYGVDGAVDRALALYESTLRPAHA